MGSRRGKNAGEKGGGGLQEGCAHQSNGAGGYMQTPSGAASTSPSWSTSVWPQRVARTGTAAQMWMGSVGRAPPWTPSGEFSANSTPALAMAWAGASELGGRVVRMEMTRPCLLGLCIHRQLRHER